MMDIKFRAWDSARMKMQTHSKWVEFKVSAQGVLSAENYNLKGFTQKLPVMQFTGMQDPSGVDIYEGDIIDYGQGRFAEIVKWKGRFTMKGINFSDGTPSCIVDFYTYPVIGNIHQNPELLEKDDE